MNEPESASDSFFPRGAISFLVALLIFSALPTSLADPKSEQIGATYKLLEAKDCLTCHSIDGSKSIGPTLKGILGRSTKLTGGTTITADETYLRESIMKPESTIVDGFDNVMPVPKLSEAELNQIIAYLKTLK